MKGENNPRALLTDDEVELLRTLYEGDQHKRKSVRYWTGPRLAEKFEISLRAVRYILAYERRTAGSED